MIPELGSLKSLRMAAVHVHLAVVDVEDGTSFRLWLVNTLHMYTVFHRTEPFSYNFQLDQILLHVERVMETHISNDKFCSENGHCY